MENITVLKKWRDRNFTRTELEFEGYKAIVILPDTPCEGNKWLLKTEYFGAFPTFQDIMIDEGYALAYITNETRWYKESDADRKARFSDWLCSEYGLNKQCMIIGMSCGGMHGVYFAAKYPEKVAALYLDAPVLNLLSCPCGVGMAGDDMYEEFKNATGFTVSDMINYRNHPIDNVDKLIENNIPVFLACGDSDTVVPFEENGKLLLEKYKAAGVEIEFVLKKGVGHHPHGLEDYTDLIAFTKKYY